MELENKSCIDCHNLRTKKVDGSYLVTCKMDKIKGKFYDYIEEIGKNSVDEALFKLQANTCKNYTLDM